jgi:hypothetical protein
VLGVPLMAVPVEFGGTWDSLAQSARPICTMLRRLAQGDPSITLQVRIYNREALTCGCLEETIIG